MKNKWINKIHCGDALAVMKEMPDNFVDMIMTSPPYWGLRDYGTEGVIWDGAADCKHDFSIKTKAGDIRFRGENSEIGNNKNPDIWKGSGEGAFCRCGAWRGELGLEPTFDLYIKHLCDIFDETKRVLKDMGTCWVNLGDTHSGSGKGIGSDHEKAVYSDADIGNEVITGLPNKSLCMIPQRFAIEMVNRGWILRNTIIWLKPSCMPAAAKDRFTIDFEYIYFFAKTNETQYWTNSKTMQIISKQPLGIHGREGKDWEYRECDICKGTGLWGGNKHKKCEGTGKIKYNFWAGHDYYFEQQFEEAINPDGGCNARTYSKVGLRSKTWGTKDMSGQEYRNKRCVWEVATKGYSEAHFATFPEEICITPIKAGCPEFICKKCGKPKTLILIDGKNIPKGGGACLKYAKSGLNLSPTSTLLTKTKKEKIFNGYANCNCNVGFKPGVLLDLFAGAGTACLTARKLGRQYIGIEIKPEYKNMGDKRIHNEAGLL